jgi:hypothetical protein
MSFIPTSCEVSSFKDKLKADNSRLSQGNKTYQNQYSNLYFAVFLQRFAPLRAGRLPGLYRHRVSFFFLGPKGKFWYSTVTIGTGTFFPIQHHTSYYSPPHILIREKIVVQEVNIVQ